MNKLLILICILTVNILTVKAQISSRFYKNEGKYFKYTIGDYTSAAQPLFTLPLSKIPEMIPAEHQDPGGQWLNFTSIFIDQVLKKYFTVEEIRKMLKNGDNRASAQIYLYFDFYGNIKYANFIYNNGLKDILTEEKLYYIYQDLIKLKIDTTGFYWWVNQERPTTEQQKKLYGVTSIPFFFRQNCP